MPFKSGKSPADAAKNVGNKLYKISHENAESATEKVGYAVGDAADYFVPIDTYDLIQSRKIVIRTTPTGYTATIGYYEPYAEFLYDDATWQPRQAGDSGKRGSGLNLNAESHWIHKGIEQVDVMAIFAREMKS